jgi:hypothetical protein
MSVPDDALKLSVVTSFTCFPCRIARSLLAVAVESSLVEMSTTAAYTFQIQISLLLFIITINQRMLSRKDEPKNITIVQCMFSGIDEPKSSMIQSHAM